MNAFDQTLVFSQKEIDTMMRDDMSESINHGILVSNLASLLSRELGMDAAFCYDMAIGGMLHDIGKLKLSKYLYGRRKDTLVIEEMKYVRMHPAFSYDILKKQGYSNFILESVYHHHENYDGTGYPDNLKGGSIPIGSRILRTCDVFAALVSMRPYRKAFDINTAMDLMIDEVKNFDMEIFLSFQRVLHSKQFNFVREFIDEINRDYPVRNKLKEVKA